MRRGVRLSGWWAAGALGVLAGGCASDPTRGYSFEGSSRGEASSIAVPVFENATHVPGLEVTLADAIAKEIQRSTAMRVVGVGEADTRLSGRIVRADLRRLSRDSTTGLAQELAVDVVVDYDWTDARTGRVLVSRRGFSGVDTFVPARPSAERLEVGQRGAIQEVARDLVGTLRSGW